MNHIYRLIWDELRGAYVAVAEIVRRRGKRAGAVVRAAAAAITVAGVPLSAHAMSASTVPNGAQVIAGNVQLSQQGANLTVHQDSQRAILNWTSFDIGSNASVRFEQPNANAVALNRVLGGTTSQVLGDLSANGQVWLVNPNGVLFGKGAQVDVGGLVVSSLGISDSDFLAGRARFAAAGSAGAVRNEGAIRAHGGVVAMLAPVVGNAGSIDAAQVGLAAGNQVALDFGGDGMLSLAVEKGALQAEIAQSGLIRGNNVLLTAAAASALHASVINMDGVVEASSLTERGGRILLDGGDTGQVHVGGTLDASAAAGTGGRIDVLGDRLTLDHGATLDASGALGGGAIHVGGGWQGKDASLHNATRVDADASVAVNARASGKGNGGEVVFWSDDSTSFAGNIDIRGGAQGGDGGRAEVSGKRMLAYSGRTHALAAKGATGDLLLDPATITIQAGGTGTGAITGSTVYVADLEAQHANVMLQADNGMTIADLGLNGGDGHLTMANDVSLRLENKAGNIVFANADNTIEVSGTASIYMQSGQTGTGELRNVANLVVHGSGTNPATLPTHNVGTPGNGTPAAGSITLYGADGITVGGALTTHGGYVRIWGDSDNMGGGALTLNSPINTAGGNLYLSTGSGDVTLNSDMRLGAGRVLFGGTGGEADGSYTDGKKILNGWLDSSGNVNINTAFTMGGNAKIYTDGNINFVGSVPITLDTGEGVLVLRASKIDWGNANLINLSTASLRLEPYLASTNMVLGDANGFASATTLAKLPGIKNLTIGREDGTGTVTVSSNFSFKAWGNFELEDKNIEVSANLTNTTGNVTLTGDNVNITGAVTASTSTGANHDPGTAGAGKVAIRQMTAANDLHLGGGLTNASVGKINAATLEVGRSNGGDLVFDSDIVTDANSVALLSGGKVLGVDGGVSASNLVIYAGDGATISDDTFDFATLALSVGGDSEVTSSRNNWSLSSSTWNLGAVDDPISITGLAIQPGSTATVGLHAKGTLGLGSAIDFNGSAATLNLVAGTFAGAATVAHQGAASVAFDQANHDTSLTVGASTSVLPGATLTSFNGSKNLTVGSAAADVVSQANLAVTTAAGGKLTLVGDTLDLSHDVAVTTGSLQVDSGSSLALAHALKATDTVTLHTDNQDISGSGVITANTLAIDSGTGDTTLSGVHQVNTLSANAGALTLKNGKSLTVNGITAAKTVDLRLSGATSDLTLADAVTAHNTDSADTAILLAAGRNFVNNAGAGAVSADKGRWLVYSTSPLDDTRGSLAGDFKQYNAHLGDTVLGAGDGFLYTVAPTVSVVLTGSTRKTYDGNTDADVDSIGHTVSGAIDGDTVTVTGGDAHYDTKNVGTGKKVTQDDLAIDTQTKGTMKVYGYTLDSTSASGNIGRIDQKLISLADGSVLDKTYDGTTDATLGSSVTLDGVVSGDTVAFGSAASVAFADRNAGDGKQVNLGAVTLTGADSGNYTVDSKAYADIARRVVTVDVVVGDKVYDGGTGATVSSQTPNNLIATDDVSLEASAAFVDKNVGTDKNVVVTASLDGDDAANYILDTTTGNPRASTAAITPKTIDAGTLSVVGKVYDGNRDATVRSSGPVGVVKGDDLSLTLGGQYDDKNAGSGKRVDVTMGLVGGDAGNYKLSHTTATSQGDISQKTIDAGTLSVAGKVYDGTRDATMRSSGPVGVVKGDDLSLTLGGQYDNKNAGSGKRVDVTLGLAGGDAGNYKLSHTTATSQGDISQKTIDAGTLSVAGKVYDGTRDATVRSSGLVGVVKGDDLSLTLGGQYDDKNAGNGKRVDVTMGLAGGDAGNYKLSTTRAQSRGDISAREVVAGPVGVVDKRFDGSRDAELILPGLDGVVGGDNVALHGKGTFDTAGTAADKTVQIDLSLGGADAGNYVLVDAHRQGKAGIADLPGRNAVDAVTQPSMGGNGTQPGNNGNGGGSTPGAVTAVSGALGDVTGSAQPKLGRSWAEPVGGGSAGAGIGGGGAGNGGAGSNGGAAGSGSATGAGTGVGAGYGDNGNGAGGSGTGGRGGVGGDTSGAGDGGAGAGGRDAQGAAAVQGDGAAAGRGAGDAGNNAGDAGHASAGQGDTSGDNGGSNSGAGNDGRGAGRGGRGGDPSLDQMLRNGDGLSLSLGGERLAQPQTSVLPVFTEEGQLLGRYRVDDMGDSLALHPASGGNAAAPRKGGKVRLRAQTEVALDEDDTASLRMALLDDGTLHIVATRNAAGLDRDAITAYGLGALKRQAGVSPQQVQAVVLGFAD